MITDPRVSLGLQSQRTLLTRKLADGELQRGWKLGFGSRSGLELIGIENPLIGFILQSGQLTNGDNVSVGNWGGPAIEAEIAVRLKHPLPLHPTPDEIRDAVDAFLPALEIVDVDHAPVEPERILSGNIFHRNYVVGSDLTEGWGQGPESLSGRVKHTDNWGEIVHEVQALTGDYLTNLAYLARTAPQVSEGTKAGEIILLGSIVPPVRVAPGESFEFQVLDMPVLLITFTR